MVGGTFHDAKIQTYQQHNLKDLTEIDYGNATHFWINPKMRYVVQVCGLL